MVSVSAASGAVGTGRFCGHRSVCAGNSVPGHIRAAVWVLLQPEREPEEEAEIKGGSDLDVCEEN